MLVSANSSIKPSRKHFPRDSRFLCNKVCRISIAGALAVFVQFAPALDKSQQAGPEANAATWIASRAGARLDSKLMTGGGADDTVALQKILDQAANGKSVRLLIDGPALVSGLDVYGNTTIECSAGGGLYLIDGASRAILRNVHRASQESGNSDMDEHITIRGCFLNGNRNHQVLPLWERDKPWSLPKDKDGALLFSVEFRNVNYLNIEDVTLWNMRVFNLVIGNGKFINIENIVIDNDSPRDFVNVSGDEEGRRFAKYANTDGINLHGLQYVTINGAKLRTGDDAISMGDVTDATISNVVLMDPLLGFRFLSPHGPVDRIVIQNVTGTVQWRFALFNNHEFPGLPKGFGSILFSDIDIDPLKVPCWDDAYKSHPQYAEIKANALKNMKGDWDCPMFAVAIPIRNLQLRHVVTKVVDGRPLIWLGSGADVQNMDVDMTALDPLLISKPLLLEAGSRVRRMNLSLNWVGINGDSGKQPIRYDGGRIDHLHWTK